MTIIQRLKACMIWIIIAVFAVINGAFRESILAPIVGKNSALPISGIILSIIIVIITYATFNLFRPITQKSCLLIGIQWVLMTLTFEFTFGHYIAHKSLSDIFQIFNILKGDLFLLVLMTSLLSPTFVARFKGVSNDDA